MNVLIQGHSFLLTHNRPRPAADPVGPPPAFQRHAVARDTASRQHHNATQAVLWQPGTRAARQDLAGPEDSLYGYTHDKDGYIKRLRRIEGQIRGLQRMVDEDKYCIDILTQIAAATRALQAVALGLLDEHLSHCVVGAVAEGGDTATEKIREASEAIARLVKS
jgi:CsoR family transcriptional regulator, copper-sensing transcriptional repressor